uniref:Uncharacterized protein n=1 Tax=Glossina austeni TaxID=7395 RepID=A0A1A9VTS7_GLOAU
MTPGEFQEYLTARSYLTTNGVFNTCFLIILAFDVKYNKKCIPLALYIKACAVEFKSLPENSQLCSSDGRASNLISDIKVHFDGRYLVFKNRSRTVSQSLSTNRTIQCTCAPNAHCGYSVFDKQALKARRKASAASATSTATATVAAAKDTYLCSQLKKHFPKVDGDLESSSNFQHKLRSSVSGYGDILRSIMYNDVYVDALHAANIKEMRVHYFKSIGIVKPYNQWQKVLYSSKALEIQTTQALK